MVCLFHLNKILHPPPAGVEALEKGRLFISVKLPFASLFFSLLGVLQRHSLPLSVSMSQSITTADGKATLCCPLVPFFPLCLVKGSPGKTQPRKTIRVPVLFFIFFPWKSTGHLRKSLATFCAILRVFVLHPGITPPPHGSKEHGLLRKCA